ncbi:MAG: bifunctional lysylphosphatidylglycerol flippase/synthetase MprF [Chloroflexota bacterium]
MAAGWTAAAGLMNIVSALYPGIPARMEILRDLLPIHLIRGSQTAVVLVGFCLILIADGLRKRRQRALRLAIGLLILSVFLNLTKGLDVEEAVVGITVAAALVLSRRAFYVRGAPATPRRLLPAVATFALLYYSYILAGFLILRHAIRPGPTLLGVTLEPLNVLAMSPAYRYITPHARWFEGSIILVAAVSAVFLVVQVLRPYIPHKAATDEELTAAHALVRRYGDDSLSYFALQNARSYFFDDGGQAFLSYRLWRNVALVGGDPVGDPVRIAPLIRSFCEYADSSGMDICFLGIASNHLGNYRSAGFHSLKIGEEAVIPLATFDKSVLKRKVRRAERHIEEMDIQAKMYRRDRLPGDILAQMHDISQSWVHEHGGAERGFSMTLGRLPSEHDRDCEVMVALGGEMVMGYLTFVPVYRSDSWSLDAMRRRAGCPNGLMEFLVIRAAEEFRRRDCRSLSLNFATLANIEAESEPRMLIGTRRFLFDHLSGYYQLKSLYQFNSKFQPEWRSRYVAYRAVLSFPKLALAIVQAEDPFRLPSIPVLKRDA